MKLIELRLNNWQSYSGEDNRFHFDGPDTTQNSAIILGRNGQGKSAFFESIKFLLYGKNAVTDNDSDMNPKPVKPIVHEDKEEGPLMCYEAYMAGEKKFGVYAKFIHEGCQFEIERYFESKTEKAPGNSFSESFYILDKNKKALPKPEDFIEEVIPETISKFFLLDGEIIQEYRKLFSRKRPGLAYDVENILRLGSLDETLVALRDIKQGLSRDKRRIEADNASNDRNAATINQLTEDIEEAEEKLADLDKKIPELRRLKDSLWAEILEDGDVNTIGEAMDDCLEEISKAKNKISELESRRSTHFNKAWKVILKPTVEASLDTKTSIIDRQLLEDRRAAVIRDKISSWQKLVDGELCTHCDRHPNLSHEEKEEYIRKISEQKKREERLVEQSQTPNSDVLREQIKSLQFLTTDTTFEDITALNKDISQQRQIIREQKRQYDYLDGKLTNESLEEARQRKDDYDDIVSELEDSENARSATSIVLERDNGKLQNLLNRGKSKSGSKTVEPIDKQIKIAKVLAEICSQSISPFRDFTREQVRKVAEPIYTDIIDENHDELQIDEQFRIKILEKNKGVRLSAGQYALAAYSILDALSRVSDIEFPFIVDTPGRSIDKEYLSDIFAYILKNKQRQVILLPTTAEIDSDRMVSDYGSEVSRIFEITKSRTDSTKINLLHERGG
jgi:DNA sulfur modification protein DndD